MFELLFIGVALAGIALVLKRFWDEIVTWLNTVAADAVESKFGINARKNMIKAVTKVDRAVNIVRERFDFYTKKNPISPTIQKIELQRKVYVSDLESDVVSEIDKKGVLTQEISYKI